MSEIRLPKLTGSEKQIKWADKIRKGYLKKFDLEAFYSDKEQFDKNEKELDKLEALFEETGDKKYDHDLYKLESIQYKLSKKIKKDELLELCFLNETSSKFYIETSSLENLLEKLENDSERVENYKADKKEEAEEKKDVQVKLEENKVTVKITNSNLGGKPLKEVVKDQGFTWGHYCWELIVNEFNSPAADRAVEVITALEKEGYSISYPSSIKEKVEKKEFNKVSKKWVYVSNGKLGIKFPKNSTLFNHLRRIKGFEYKDYSITFPISSATEILDFASENNFSVSDAVYDLLKIDKKDLEILSEKEVLELMRDDD